MQFPQQKSQLRKSTDYQPTLIKVVRLTLLLLIMMPFGLAVADDSKGALPIPENPSFAHDIQPIFAKSCTGCHGGVKQAGDISFVYADSILPPDGWVVEPGDPDESVLFQRIISDDPDDRMPPPDEHPDGLSEREIELIRRWIQQGAKWEDHWSRMPLVAPSIPESDQSIAWANKPLDHFIYSSLRQHDLSPTREAEPEQWLRRVSFDLIGLPPTLEELDAFVEQLSKSQHEVDRELVYEQEVERLLASPHFGERWASMWMDLARYADSKGFEKDPHREMWPYRNWLIEAFNQDMPYDEFTIKQLAGDLMPDPSFDDLVATAFHRNTQTNTEGGTDDEEFRIAAVIDRLSTTWTTWQATTFGCVQCHAHPYEPYQHDEFYAGLSLFNNSEDADLDHEKPAIPYLSDKQLRVDFVRTGRELNEAEKALDSLSHTVAGQSQWELLPINELESTTGTIGKVGDEVRVIGGTVAVGSTYKLSSDVSSITALRFTIRPESDDPAKWPEQGSVLSHLEVAVIGKEGKSTPVKLDAVIPDYRAGANPVEKMLQKGSEGFGGYPKIFEPRWVVVTLTEPLQLGESETLELKLNQSASVTGGLSNHLRRFKVEFSATPSLSELGKNEAYAKQRETVDSLRREMSKFKGPSLPIMQDRVLDAARETRLFLRGNWLDRGDVVEPKIPDVFQIAADGKPIQVTNRLEFAQWLVSRDNPMASRVWVNRIWNELFGIGIVETLEDFGVSGEPPSNLELLNFLASQMQSDLGWSLKSLLRELVLSATYRQDNRVDAERKEKDPRNRLLARGPRTRLTAEMVRDQALVASGKLASQMGGPSVMPPQPDGVWQQVYSGAAWKAAEGEDRFRRGVYTYWKRTSPYPGFVMFDTPNRDICSPRRIATNTPLQALVTLNSEVYTELAQFIADRAKADTSAKPSATPRDLIREIYVRVISREPSEEDLADLMMLCETLLTQRATVEEAAVREPATDETVTNETSESETKAQDSTAAKSMPAKLDPLGIVALAILNSDLAITK
ncbi:PSD1 and planctomycete cytochrome C domain-containing protein [Novipirellula sp. SH528]|uniref:PSD1 and planctomycete cytochrome C domain-containing protein n=1 Tax=Novipirellula sp. SH528 TaxID=3454466 RepID=UPI003FA00CED